MLNGIWAFMVVGGFLFGLLTGQLHVLTGSFLDGAADAVSLSLTLLGVVAFWCGAMEIAKEAGLVERLAKGMWPFIHFMFPNVPRGHRALDAISVNFIANILGLGWAATPAGLEAMEALAELSEEEESGGNQTEQSGGMKAGRSQVPLSEEGEDRGNKRRKKNSTGRAASEEMCTFLVLNISSLQLIPVTIIAYRTQYGSANPTAIVGPALFATTISTAAAIVFCKLIFHGKRCIL